MTKLESRGQRLFELIADELSALSKDVRGDTYRRQEDFRELCIALALLEDRLNKVERRVSHDRISL